MDKRAAGQYLDQIFGTNQGFVAVAYKDKGQSWQECSFAWPSDRSKLLAWAEIHQDANIFICPALRQDGHTRKKGDMKPSRWLWADVDWQGVPADRVEDVKTRIMELGSIVVKSGTTDDRTGQDNVHVYVQLSRDVFIDEFKKLNTGLRDYLYADNKQADNSLLRLPGTTNWKTDAGSAVVWSNEKRRRGEGINPAVLMKRRAFRDAKVIEDADATEWDFIEVEGLPRRVRAMVNMSVPEAEARYGNRHKAVWAVTGELHKRGLGPDEVHSLMHHFPPALSKAADENGYDVHRDVDKRLAWDRASVQAGMSEEEAEDMEEEAFELASEEDDANEYEERVLRLALIEMERAEARRRARQMEAERTWTAPPVDATTTLSDALSNPPAPQQYLIQDMCSAEGFVVIAGQYKTGKTFLMANSLLTALADNEPFLGIKDVFVPDGGAVCGHWNLEMTALDLIDKYMRKAQFKNPHNVHVANWQGYGVNLLTEPGKRMAIEWLTTRRVQVWTIDSWSALCRTSGVDPNDGGQVGALAQAIIDIKVQAGVQAVFLLAHISRASQESDRPGTKGAVDLDAIVDTRWMMTIDKSDVRFLQVEGRGTTMPVTSLDFDEETGRSKLGTVGRASAAHDGWIQVVMSIVNDNPQGINGLTLFKKMCEKGHPKNKTRAMECIKEAAENGFIRIERGESTGKGGRAPMLHFPVEGGNGEDDGATAQVVDFSRVGTRPGGRRR